MDEMQVVHENEIFCIESDYENMIQVSDLIDNRGTELAQKVGINRLPHEYKIRIQLMRKEKFEKEKSLFLKVKTDFECYAFSTYCIKAVAYEEIKSKIKMQAYCKMILHEVIHVLQHISTAIHPDSAVWLYESIACYLAEQFPDYDVLAFPEWKKIKEDFYAVRDCYSIAYLIGKYLFDTFTFDEVMNLSKEIDRAERICGEWYSNKLAAK